jgi:hypothetical protein
MGFSLTKISSSPVGEGPIEIYAILKRVFKKTP